MEEDNGHMRELHVLEDHAQDLMELFHLELHFAKIMQYSNVIRQQEVLLTLKSLVHQLYVDQ